MKRKSEDKKNEKTGEIVNLDEDHRKREKL